MQYACIVTVLRPQTQYSKARFAQYISDFLFQINNETKYSSTFKNKDVVSVKVSTTDLCTNVTYYLEVYHNFVNISSCATYH